MAGLNPQDEIVCALQQKVKNLTENVATLEASTEKFCNRMQNSDRICSSQISQRHQAELELSAVRLELKKLKEQQTTIPIVKQSVNDNFNRLILKQSKAIHRFFNETSIDWVDRSIEVGIQMGLNQYVPEQLTVLRNELHKVLEGHFNEVVEIQQDFIDLFRAQSIHKKHKK
jgi:hypothetical protein